jgi:hypothetical protein
MLNALIALKTLNYRSHPQVKRAERELKKLEHETADSVRIEPLLTCVDTAIVAICLRESDVSTSRAEEICRVADDQRNSFSRGLAVQEWREGRAERVGLRV